MKKPVPCADSQEDRGAAGVGREEEALFTIFPPHQTAGSAVPGTLMGKNGQCAESLPATPGPPPLGRSFGLTQPRLTAPYRRLCGSGRVTIRLLLKARAIFFFLGKKKKRGKKRERGEGAGRAVELKPLGSSGEGKSESGVGRNRYRGARAISGLLRPEESDGG